MKIFKDRQSAGRLLAIHLRRDWGNLGAKGIVLGIPRGGVVVASEIAKELNLPLDIIITRKIGAPNQPELALGAVDSDGEVIWDESLKQELRIKNYELREEVENQRQEITRREKVYRQDRKALDITGKIVILVDDGIATGATTLAAIRFLKRHKAKKIILAVPVADKEAVERVIREIGGIGDTIVLETPEYFQAVGQFYEYFLPVSDDMVIQLTTKLSSRT